MRAEASRAGSLTIPGKSTGVNRWLVVAALLLLAAAAYVSYTRFFQPAAPAAPPQTADVTIGTVASTVTATGTVVSEATSQLAFKGSGRVEQVAVSVGDQVKRGQLLVRMDDTELKVQVAQAEAQLASAIAKLDALKAGSRSEDLASAEAALASARAKLSQVQKGATPADIQAAQSSVASARNNLEAAESKLADLQGGPKADELAAARGSVQQARASLASAEAKLKLVTAGPTQADWASAQSAVDSAQAGLKTAQSKLDELRKGPTQTDLASAQAAVNSAKQALTTAEDRYEMAKGDNLKESGFSSVSAAQQSFETAQANYEAAVQKLNELASGPKSVDLQAAQSAVDSAQASYNSAVAKLELMKQGVSPEEVQQAQSAVDSAKAGLVSAEVKLAQLEAGPADVDLVQAKGAVDSARAALASAEAKLADLRAGAKPEDMQVARSSVAQAEAQLSLKQSPYTESDITSAEAAVKQAESSLMLAQYNLANASLVAPFDGVVSAVATSPGQMASGAVVTLVNPTRVRVDVSMAETDVARVQLGQSVEITMDALPEARFAGKVVAIAPTATVQSGVATYQVSLSVDGMIRQQRAAAGAGMAAGSWQSSRQGGQAAGQQGTGSRQAAGGQRALQQGSQGALAPQAGVTASNPAAARDGSTFQDQPEDVQKLFTGTYGDDAERMWAQQHNREMDVRALKPGMTASATIFYAQKENVLAVPNRAIRSQGPNRTVEVLVNGAPEERAVTVGLVGDQTTEVVEGLSEGEKVVIPTGTGTTTTAGSSSIRVPGGPGLGGGMFPGGGPPR